MVISSNFPINQTVGASTDCSSILLADMSQVVVGVSRQVEIQMSTDYAFGSDQIALRVTFRYDIGLPQPTALVKTCRRQAVTNSSPSGCVGVTDGRGLHRGVNVSPSL